MITRDAAAQAHNCVSDDLDYARALAAALERELGSETIRRAMRVWELAAPVMNAASKRCSKP